MSRALGVESGNQPDVVGASALLEIEDLKTHFFTASGVVKAVDEVAAVITAAIVWRWGKDGPSRAVLTIVVFPVCLLLALAIGQGIEFEKWWGQNVAPTLIAILKVGFLILCVVASIIYGIDIWRNRRKRNSA